MDDINNKSPLEDFSAQLNKLYVYYSNKFILLTAALDKNEQIILAAVNDLNLTHISKPLYDKAFTKLESNISKANIELDKIKHLTEIIEKFKNVSNRIEELYKKSISNYENASTKINNRYLNTGSKLTQLALAKLPENNAEIEQAILDSLDASGEINTVNPKIVVKNMMASVKDARTGRGGSKKRTYLKRKKNN